MTGRRRSAALLPALVLVGALGAGCVSAPVRAAPGTTVAPAPFCGPLQAMATDAWSTGDRSRFVGDLAAARAAAPKGMQAPLDDLLAMEQAHTPPGSDDRWFDAMAAVADVADRECGVDLTAGAPVAATPGSAPRASQGTAVGGTITFDDLVALVRSTGRGASWTGQTWSATVADDGDTVQVVVDGVEDVSLAQTMCEDLRAAAPSRPSPPTITIVSRAGFVQVLADHGPCHEPPAPGSN